MSAWARKSSYPSTSEGSKKGSMGFRAFLQNLFRKPKSEDVASPYADFQRVTKTGKVRAKGGEWEARTGWFGIDETVVELPELSQNGKNVYIYLSKIADKDGYCFPFYRTIAKKCSISESTVAKAIRELEEAGLLTKRQRVSRRGGSSNLYQVRKMRSQRTTPN